MSVAGWGGRRFRSGQRAWLTVPICRLILRCQERSRQATCIASGAGRSWATLRGRAAQADCGRPLSAAAKGGGGGRTDGMCPPWASRQLRGSCPRHPSRLRARRCHNHTWVCLGACTTVPSTASCTTIRPLKVGLTIYLSCDQAALAAGRACRQHQVVGASLGQAGCSQWPPTRRLTVPLPELACMQLPLGGCGSTACRAVGAWVLLARQPRPAAGGALRRENHAALPALQPERKQLAAALSYLLVPLSAVL